MTKSGNLILSLVGFAFSFGLAIAPVSSSYAEGKEHKLVIHMDENDPKKMNLALNIVEQSKKEWARRGDTITVEVVAHGPGLHMLRDDTSPVKKRIGLITLKLDNVIFSACGNTLKKQSKKEGHAVPLIADARQVPAGVVRIMELQEIGYSYVRP